MSTTPTNGSTDVQANTSVAVEFSTTPASNSATPVISPHVTGTWSHESDDELVFTPDQSFVPFTKYTVTIPGGAHGVTGADGSHLHGETSADFTVANGSLLRLQQLLAKLGYLPLSFTGATPSLADAALPQTGTFAWRWPGLPSQLTDQWIEGVPNAITKSAIMMFETENDLSVDGVAGPAVWTALLAADATDKANAEPWTYVLVTKVDPEHLTAWVNGALDFKDILVNTGVLGATTTNGTFEVFEHVRTSDMKGTDVTGKKYTDPSIPWVSYFHGGEALHGYVRAEYGFPQSNGCVEMKITTAGKLWPDTPLGTLVTLQGPTPKQKGPTAGTTTTAHPGTAPTTTTTTAPPATITTTAPATAG
ncbi:MAG: L,D-transpeptidase family protein [Acidimicrobiales bacterium]